MLYNEGVIGDVIRQKRGFIQALSVAGYCFLVGIIFWLGPKFFPKANPYFGPVMVLILFSTSVLICGLLVFYRPYRLFFEGKKKEAIDVVVSTSLWLFVFLFISFILMILF